jgi:hypothetical protein
VVGGVEGGVVAGGVVGVVDVGVAEAVVFSDGVAGGGGGVEAGGEGGQEEAEAALEDDEESGGGDDGAGEGGVGEAGDECARSFLGAGDEACGFAVWDDGGALVASKVVAERWSWSHAVSLTTAASARCE